MNLVIVESPAKTKTIKEFLGKDFEVVASKGHIRDIENSGKDNLGLDFNNNYKPIYSIIPHQQATIRLLNKEVEKADNIYLATDPDREGEAISWHLKEVLNIGTKPVKRIEFNEITKDAILEAINTPRDIDENLFASQETRKIMDRIIGYKLSSLLKKNIISSGDLTISAGRVQSACLRIITDREEEIKAFKPTYYYEIEAQFRHFKAKLIDPNHPSKTLILDELGKVQSIIDSLDDFFVVKEIKMGKRIEKAPAPFTTSTLFQQALSKFSMSVSKTKKIAQELYEGIEINGRHQALITYIRTDSTRLSDTFIRHLGAHIKKKYGDDAIGYVHTFNNNQDIQDAHEAIRPVSMYNTIESIEPYLSKDQLKIYKLIYQQTEACMMRDAEFETKTALLSNNNYDFSITFEKPINKGYRVAKEKTEEPKYYFPHEIGDIMKPTQNVSYIEKQTEGPKPFTEATLIKEMESSGIGRPSTYASTIETLKSRNYIVIEKKAIIPTQLGILASNYLKEHFSSIINVDYTASMEKELAEIALNEAKEEKIVDDFYKTFIKTYNDAIKIPSKPLTTGEICPNCGHDMVYRTNRYGTFEACSNYPACKYIKKKDEPEPMVDLIPCPECSTGHLVSKVAKTGRYAGRKFYGCSNFPECKFTISYINQKKQK